MQEHENVSNTSRHQDLVVLALNLPCYSHFPYVENFKHLFWKIMTFAVVTLFFWRGDISKTCFQTRGRFLPGWLHISDGKYIHRNKLLRYVHTMPRSTQWQSAARSRGKSCAMPQVYVNVMSAWLRHAIQCCVA